MRSYNSHGQTIEVTPRLCGIFLWTVFGLEVRVGDRVFLPKMNRISFWTSTEFEFHAQGERVTGIVRSLSPVWFIPRVPYSITVNGVHIANDKQVLARWPLFYVGWILAGLISFLISTGAGVTILYLPKLFGS